VREANGLDCLVHPASGQPPASDSMASTSFRASSAWPRVSACWASVAKRSRASWAPGVASPAGGHTRSNGYVIDAPQMWSVRLAWSEGFHRGKTRRCRQPQGRVGAKTVRIDHAPP